MGAIEFAKNIQTTGKTIFSEKTRKHTWFYFFVSFLQVLCLSTPREVSASSTKNKTHNTNTNHAHTHTLIKIIKIA